MSEEWHHIDAGGKVLGRLATQVAGLLLGKHRTDTAPNLVAPVYVVVTNVKKIVLTGKKEQQKMYRKHSGYPGGLKEKRAADVRKKDAHLMIKQAVAGMLPKNGLRTQRMAHLKLYDGDQHPHQAQLSS